MSAREALERRKANRLSTESGAAPVTAGPQGTSAAPAKSRTMPVEGQGYGPGLFQALQSTKKEPAITAGRNTVLGMANDKARREAPMPFAKSTDDLIDSIVGGARSMGRKFDPISMLGGEGDTFDTVGSVMASAFPTYQKAREAQGAGDKRGMLDLMLEAGPEVYKDIKGAVDYEAEDFIDRKPSVDRVMGNVGTGLGYVTGAKALGHLGKKALEGTAGAFKKYAINDIISPLSKAIRGK